MLSQKKTLKMLLAACLSDFQSRERFHDAARKAEIEYMTTLVVLEKQLRLKHGDEVVDTIVLNAAATASVEETARKRSRYLLATDPDYMIYMDHRAKPNKMSTEVQNCLRNNVYASSESVKELNPTILVSSTQRDETLHFMHEFYTNVTGGRKMPLPKPFETGASELHPTVNVYFIHGDRFRVRARMCMSLGDIVEVEAVMDEDIRELLRSAGCRSAEVTGLSYPIIIEVPKIPEDQVVLFAFPTCTPGGSPDTYSIYYADSIRMYLNVSAMLHPTRMFYNNQFWETMCREDSNSTGTARSNLVRLVLQTTNPHFIQFDVVQRVPTLQPTYTPSERKLSLTANAEGLDVLLKDVHGRPSTRKGYNDKHGNKRIRKQTPADVLYPSFQYHAVCGLDKDGNSVGYADLIHVMLETRPSRGLLTAWKEFVVQEVYTSQGELLVTPVQS